jgi:hypothetical protein
MTFVNHNAQHTRIHKLSFQQINPSSASGKKKKIQHNSLAEIPLYHFFIAFRYIRIKEAYITRISGEVKILDWEGGEIGGVRHLLQRKKY